MINGDTIQGKIAAGGIVKQLLDSGKTPPQVIESLSSAPCRGGPRPKSWKNFSPPWSARDPQLGLRTCSGRCMKSREFLFNH
jgi:hypothetical protein